MSQPTNWLYLFALHCSYAYLFAPHNLCSLTPIVFCCYRRADEYREGESTNSYESVSFSFRFTWSLNIHTHREGKQRAVCVCVICSCSHLDFRFVFSHQYKGKCIIVYVCESLKLRQPIENIFLLYILENFSQFLTCFYRFV